MASRKPINAAELPARIVFDSSVMIRALEHANPARAGDPLVADCRTLWERALRESRVLMPASVVLEVLGGEGGPEGFPAVRSVEHVAYSYRAAERMARWARPEATGPRTREKKPTRRVVSYDALLVGTAAFYGADVLVTLDEGVKALAKLAGVPTAEPSELLRGTQGRLFE